jgi:hypothetical protein
MVAVVQGIENALLLPERRQGLSRVLTQAHVGVLYTFSTRTSATAAVFATSSQLSSSSQGKWYSPSGKVAWTVHHNKNLTLLGHSPPATLY